MPLEVKLMGVRRIEVDNFIDAIGGEIGPSTAATFRIMAILIAAIEDLGEDLVESLRQRWEDETARPLTAEESIAQTDSLLDMLHRKQALIAKRTEHPDWPKRKAQVSTENPPRESADEEADG